MYYRDKARQSKSARLEGLAPPGRLEEDRKSKGTHPDPEACSSSNLNCDLVDTDETSADVRRSGLGDVDGDE